MLTIPAISRKLLLSLVARKHIFRTAMTSQHANEAATKKVKLSAEEKKSNIVWVDLEMSGLDINTEHILEMACLVTDGQLNILAEGPNLIIHQEDHVLDNMGEWCKEHHGQSGLTEAVRNSKISLKSAETQMLEFVKQYTDKGTAPLAGNSIHADRMFLLKYMPDFLRHLHYRIIDVSTIKELCRRWYPNDFTSAPQKKLSHRALDDIKESIQELKYYRKSVFK